MALIALVYGRDAAAKEATRLVLESLGHTVRDFDEARRTIESRPFNHAIVDNLFDGVEAAVVVLTPDDNAQLNQMLMTEDPGDWLIRPSLRPNVWLELGMAIGRLGPRVIELSFHFPHSAIASDLIGLNPIRWSNAPAVAKEVSSRFSALGISTVNSLPSDLELITYKRPFPSFEAAIPPYSFISNPWKLRRETINGLPDWEKRAYQEAGYELSNDYEEFQANWVSQGKQLYIHKHVSGEFVVPRYDAVGNGTGWRYHLVKKTS